jgi:hypothetical protein
MIFQFALPSVTSERNRFDGDDFAGTPGFVRSS